MGFWKSFFDNAVSIFAFAALILEIFTLIANTYNVRFLRDMYFARLTQNNEQFMDFGLWGSCNGTDNVVISCSTPKAGFVWTNADGFNSYIPGGLDGYDQVFLANFVLYWGGLALTLFVFVFSIFSHYDRITDFTAATVTTLAFVVLLVVFCISIVVATRIIQIANATGLVVGTLGSATWLTLGAMAGLLLAMIYFCLGCFFRVKRTRTYGRV